MYTESKGHLTYSVLPYTGLAYFCTCLAHKTLTIGILDLNKGLAGTSAARSDYGAALGVNETPASGSLEQYSLLGSCPKKTQLSLGLAHLSLGTSFVVR